MHGMQTCYDKLQKLQAVPSIFNFHYSAFEEEGVIHRDVEDRISQDQIFTFRGTSLYLNPRKYQDTCSVCKDFFSFTHEFFKKDGLPQPGAFEKKVFRDLENKTWTRSSNKN